MRWPAPSAIAVERRVVRAGRRLVEQIGVSSDGVGFLEAEADAIAPLLRPLREATAMRPDRAAVVGPTNAISILDGVAERWLSEKALDPLLEVAMLDLESLPAGAGFGAIVWRDSLRGHNDAEEPVPWILGRFPDGRELHLTPGPSVPLRMSFRVWSPSLIPPSLLARLSAALGADGADWRHLSHGEKRDAARIAIETARPLRDSNSVATHVVAHSATLLASRGLTPPQRGRERRIGRPWIGRPSTTGAELGRVLTASGALTRLHVPWNVRERHTFICGRTGSGKSELMLRLALDDMKSGRGLVLLDPHGDLADRLLGLIPLERAKDVVLIEPCNERTAAIPAIDPRLSSREQLATLDDVFAEIYSRGIVYSSRWRRPAALALSALEELPSVEPSLVGLHRLMTDEQTRTGVQAALTGTSAGSRLANFMRHHWDHASTQGTGLCESPGRFAFDHAARWNIADAVRNGQIIVAKVDLGRLGRTDASRTGQAFLTVLFKAIGGLAAVPPEARPRISVIVDEAQLFSDGQVLAAMLAQMRKFGGALTLCSQAPSRLGTLLPEVLTNCGTVLALQVAQAEARSLSDRGSAEAIELIPQLPRFHAVAMLDGAPLDDERPLVLHPLPPLASDGDRALAVSEGARRRYGRDPATAALNDLERFAILTERMDELDGAQSDVPLLRRKPRLELPGARELVDAALAGDIPPSIPGVGEGEGLAAAQMTIDQIAPVG